MLQNQIGNNDFFKKFYTYYRVLFYNQLLLPSFQPIKLQFNQFEISTPMNLYSV